MQEQYEREPEKVINADIEKNTDEIVSNKMVKTAMKVARIKREDIRQILIEIQDEVCNENRQV